MRVSDGRSEVSAGKVRGVVRPRLIHRDFPGRRDYTRPLGQSWLKWQRYRVVPFWSTEGLLLKSKPHFTTAANQQYLRFDVVL
jgi:hypothetical protein